jgi:hypothetical protein
MIVASDHNAVVETTAGKVRGFTRNGIRTFKGIPYAASAEASGCFFAPAKLKPLGWYSQLPILWPDLSARPSYRLVK